MTELMFGLEHAEDSRPESAPDGLDGQLVERAMADFVSFLAFDVAIRRVIRRVIRSTNAIERQRPHPPRGQARGHFPHEQAVLKCACSRS